MLRNIHLHGRLADDYIPVVELDVETPAEAIHALMIQLPSFEKTLRDGEFVCVRGDYDTGVECDEDLLRLKLGTLRDFHLIPAAVGRGGGGGKILLGVALIGATLISGGAALAAYGGAAGLGGLGATAGAAFGGGLVGAIGGFASLGGLALGTGALLVLGGVSQVLSLAPKSTSSTASDDKPAYLFNGAINTNDQGSAVPLVFGRILAGSVVVSAGITNEVVSTNSSISTAATQATTNSGTTATTGNYGVYNGFNHQGFINPAL